MTRRFLFLVALTAVFATPAFAQDVTTEHDESVDFSKFKTFAIREGEVKTKSPLLSSELTKKKIETEIEKALTAKGFTRATGPRADLNVFFTMGSLPSVETERYPAGWRGRQTRVVKVPNTQGTMVIDMRDPTTRSLVWRSVAIEKEPNPSKLADKLDDMVKKSIKEFPPKK